jgi:hypothetical protein
MSVLLLEVYGGNEKYSPSKPLVHYFVVVYILLYKYSDIISGTLTDNSKKRFDFKGSHTADLSSYQKIRSLSAPHTSDYYFKPLHTSSLTLPASAYYDPRT